ncbi:LytR/AlgR family response regulator transcription factor [Bernardetia sp.]|uniref:LytR/AlgR family response regulator transcription factor n=1 Tax=Bernardetia sp. TaxID=1937974 RepID=UPI0025C395C1|nr:LytTR family DNA-binding domain-containing protein [Bernardetia sp.]
MNIFIVEDNPTISRFLLQVIPTLDPSYNIVGTVDTVKGALEFLRNIQPDLLLLDVELPDGKGFDILQKWNQENQKERFDGSVVFATAHNHYALQAIKHSALDYLVKPINVNELKTALKKAFENTEQLSKQFMNDKIEVLRQNIENVQTYGKDYQNQKIVLSDAEKIYLVAIEDIVRCEAERSYTSFFLKEGKHITISKSIKVIEEMLPESIFYRVHRSHLINLTYFDFLDKKDGGTVYLKDGSTLPIAIRRKDTLIERLRQI